MRLTTLCLAGALAGVLAGATPALARRQIGYCSAYRDDGQWALSYREGGTIQPCNDVRLMLFGGSGGQRLRTWSGVVFDDSWNSVWLRCASVAQVFDGYGTDPLAAALAAAQANGYTYCLFYGSYSW